MILFSFFLFQADADEDVKRQSLLDLVTQGGPLGIAIVVILLVLSIMAVSIFVERSLPLRVQVR